MILLKPMIYPFTKHHTLASDKSVDLERIIVVKSMEFRFKSRICLLPVWFQVYY